MKKKKINSILKKVLEDIQKNGFLRVKLDGELMRVEEALDLTLNPRKTHTLSILVDRLSIDKSIERARLAESIETALRFGKGILEVEIFEKGKDKESNQKLLKTFKPNFSPTFCTLSL